MSIPIEIPIIERWSHLENNNQIYGIFTDRHSKNDGREITTSRIIEISGNVITTRNSVYCLGEYVYPGEDVEEIKRKISEQCKSAI